MKNGGSTPKATPHTIPAESDNSGGGGPKAQTPRDRDMQCDNCGVERIAYRGTDPTDGIMKYVGDKCYYIVKRSDDITPLD